MPDCVYFPGPGALEGLCAASPHPFWLDGQAWPSVARYVQVQKDAGVPEAELARLTIRAVRAKFLAHPHLQEALLYTGNGVLIDPLGPFVPFPKGGQCSFNHFGFALMALREELGNPWPEGFSPEATGPTENAGIYFSGTPTAP